MDKSEASFAARLLWGYVCREATIYLYPATGLERMTGKSCNGQIIGQPRKSNAEKCPKNVEKMFEYVQKLSGGAANIIFGHVLDNFYLFGQCFIW